MIDRKNPSKESLNGFIVINKPLGVTSQWMVNRIKKLFSARRVGHVGTLDPFATGVLPIALGKANRLAEVIHSQPKSYVAELSFGFKTSTGDLEGDIIAQSDIIPSPKDIAEILPEFIGQIEQTPPKYSAIKVEGRRAYELARQGQELTLPTRKVEIYSLEALEFRACTLKLAISCSSGTYIRSLAEDIAERLGAYGYLSNLVRTSVGAFSIESSITIEELESVGDYLQPALIHPPDDALTHLPAVVLDERDVQRISNGATVKMAHISEEPIPLVRIYSANGEIVGLAESRDNTLFPRIMLK